MGKASRRRQRGYCGCWLCDPSARRRQYEYELDRLAEAEMTEEAQS